MKKIFATIAAMLMLASAANAQSGLGGLLGSIFGGNKTTEESVANTAGSILESVLGTVISQNVNVSLPGTWTYAGAYKEKLESKMDGYLKKVGIVPGVATISFNSDNTFTIASSTKTIASGTYTYENKVLKMKFGKVYNYLSMTGTVTASTSGAQVLFEAGKFLEFAKKAIKVVGAGKDNSTLSTIAGLSDQVTGLKLGFDMKK